MPPGRMPFSIPPSPISVKMGEDLNSYQATNGEPWCIFDAMDLFKQNGDQYGRIARYYDAMLEPMIHSLRNKVSRVVSENGPGPVLDLCCGTGRQLIMLGRQGVSGVGVDMSSAMLNVAKRKNNGMTRFIRGDVTRLPFGDGRFSAAMVTLALHENPEPARQIILAEAKRVLRPDGRFIIVDYSRLEPNNHGLGGLLTSKVEWMAGDNHYYNFKDFMAKGGVEGMCDRGGLAVERVADFFFGSVGLYITKSD